MAKLISRRNALKTIGEASLASAFLPTLRGEAPTAGGSTAEAPRPKVKGSGSARPNLIFITGEGVPQSVLSCYGSTINKTPNIDRIASGGMRFTNGFTTNALCAPSRATLLTGKYSHLNGMLGNPGEDTTLDSTFDASQPTIAKIVKTHGYQTGLVGKWHLPANPGEAGFDYFVYKEGAGGPYYEADGYLQNKSFGSNEIEKASYPGYVTDNVIDLTIRGIEQFTEPFVMMVQFFNAHRPFDPPHKYENNYASTRFAEPGTFWDDYSQRAVAAKEARMRIADMPDFNAPATLTERQRKQWNYQQFMAHFLETVHAQDDAVGRLLDYLDAKGLAENTIIIYTTDHGFFMGDHGWFDKRFMYEQSIRVPWMVRHPGKISPGSVSNHWTPNIDNAPTILDLLDIAVPADMQGKSLVPVFTGTAAADVKPSLYYHYYGFGKPHWVMPHYGIRTERYKLIWYYTINEWELFDLDHDPDEMESLFNWEGYSVHPGYEAVVDDLVKQLRAAREKYGDNTGRPVTFTPTADYD